MTKLDLSHNELEEIPAAIGNLAECQILLATANRLRKIPSELFCVLPLRQLNLRRNALEALPAGALLCQASSLVELVLSENRLVERVIISSHMT